MRSFTRLKLPGRYSAWVLLVTMAVVALLAYQQYRWIDKIANVEAKTSQEKFEASLNAFANDFDTEITRAHLLFAGLDGKTQSDVLQKARERLLMFRKLSSYPAMIASVKIEEALPAPYMIDSGPPLAILVPTIFGPPITGKTGRQLPFQVAGAFAARAAGGFQVGTAAGMRFMVGVPLQIRVVLDQKYIGSVLLQKLLERHLGPGAEQHYDLLISWAKDTRPVLRWGAQDNKPWDSTVRIFAIRPDCLLGPNNRTYTIRSGQTTLTTTNEPIIRPQIVRSAMPDLTSLLRRRESCGDRSNAIAGLWLVNIRARPSLKEAIDSARRQNLAISFGVMLVLAMAITVLFISGHRARELAARHEQFAAGVSHELRTPLSIISSASANLADGVVENTDQVRQYGKMIHTHSEQLCEMIENALWFAHRDARDQLETQDLDVGELVATATATCGRVLQQAGVALERDIEPGLPYICANRVLLLHALQNLLTNVARHGRSGKWARIRAAHEGSKVVFTVEDRGVGIPAEEAARVFEPFYRGKGAKETRQGGLGLGLSLVKKIVEAHGGMVELRSKGSPGTTIAFTVPICDAEELYAHVKVPELRDG